MKTINLLVSLLILAMLLGCSKDENSAEVLEWDFGRNDYQMTFDDAEREFIVHVPQSYDGSQSYPVVFMLHGASGNGEKFYNISRWKEKGEEEGIISVYPTALKYKLVDKTSKITRWSTPALSEILEDSTTIIKDDVIFIDGILDVINATFNIDENQTYCVGFSNGGGFTRTRLYPELPYRFTAFGTSGGLSLGEVRDIPSGIHNSLYMIIGSKDQNLVEASGILEEVPFNGEEFMNHDFYGEIFKVVIEQCGLEETYTEESNPPMYNVLKFEDSQTSSNNKLYLSIVNDLQHNYANESNNPHGVIATNMYWDWFQSN